MAVDFADRRVRGVGRPELDEGGRLGSFEVSGLDLATDVGALSKQTGFFEPHELRPVTPGDLKNLDEWAIDGPPPDVFHPNGFQTGSTRWSGSSPSSPEDPLA
jgi:hypothetical protein